MKHRFPHKQSITVLDIVCIALAIGVATGLFVFSLQRGGDVAQVEITTAQHEFVYVLDEDRELVLDGPLGETRVTIQNGSVDVTDSPGRRKICVNALPISTHGEWLACLPNQIFLRVTGGISSSTDGTADESALDAIAF